MAKKRHYYDAKGRYKGHSSSNGPLRWWHLLIIAAAFYFGVWLPSQERSRDRAKSGQIETDANPRQSNTLPASQAPEE